MSTMVSDIQARLRMVIQRHTSESRRYSEMERLTGIPATSWNKFYNGKQRPTVYMFEAVSQLWPEYAYWIMTGVTDAANGHLACLDDGSGASYPERRGFHGPRNAARPYFLHAIAMQAKCASDDYIGSSIEAEDRVSLIRHELGREGEASVWKGSERLLESLNQALKSDESANKTLPASTITSSADDDE